VVLNAGAIRAAPVWDTSDEDYEMLMKVNVDQVFHVTRAAVPVLPEGGRIIAIGSVNADKMPMPGIGLYGATKAAVAALVQGWARDLAQKGITINTVQPGPVDTDMNPDGGPFSEVLTPHTALGRYGKAEEVARVVRFLASPDSSYVTGARIDVDGGFKS
jgi:3-oxoacyl-[acyl-carrier protein] reductase